MNSALQGIRVVDWSLMHLGPFAAAMLADLGAEVIHVEERGQGDAMRGLTRVFGKPATFKGRHIMFEELNRNKKGIAIDLKKPKGLEIMYKLVERSDVFLTNFRSQAIEKLGLDYKTLSRHNPRLIYACSSAFGPRGPENQTPGLEITAYAKSGVMLASGEEGMPPIYLPVGLGDRVGALYLAYGILVALLARDRSGIGQQVVTSQLGGMINLESWSLMMTLWLGEEYPRQQRSKARNPIYNWYLCRDNTWIAFGMGQFERYWPAFCGAIGMPELTTDPRFQDEAIREENAEVLVSLLDKVFATKTYDEWERIFKETGDFIFSKVNRLTDLASDPQVVANDYIIDWMHPAVGKVKFPGFPIEFEKTPMTLRSAAPELGQHTEEVLVESCGYTWEDVAKLREEEVI